MQINGRISQIKSNIGNVFINIDDADSLGINIWTSIYKCPTYICRSGVVIYFIQLDDEECAKEYFKKNKFDSIEKII